MPVPPRSPVAVPAAPTPTVRVPNPTDMSAASKPRRAKEDNPARAVAPSLPGTAPAHTPAPSSWRSEFSDRSVRGQIRRPRRRQLLGLGLGTGNLDPLRVEEARSEEPTSELQSLAYLVC